MNIDIKNLVRKNILNMSPYSSARDEFSGTDGIFLDANENPNGVYNRYPDPHQAELKGVLAKVKSVSPDNIFLGNGSDEGIDLIFRTFANPGKDKVIICPPTYGMYEVSANINDVEIVNIPLLPNFQLDKKAIFESIDQDPTIKLIFICSPNNPTGNLISGIDEIVARFNGIVVVDEAYIDFSPESTKIQSIYSHNNLIVLQTLSKAWGLAGVRVGFAFAQPEIIALLNKIKAPYNISILNQQEALLKLLKTDEFEAERDEILAERERMEKELLQLPIVRKIYPSSANFLLVEIIDENNVYKTLVGKNIIVRNRDSVIKNCMRITVGTKEENNSLLTGLKDISL
jgi:histidinol-phosphate aminotransferase